MGLCHIYVGFTLVLRRVCVNFAFFCLLCFFCVLFFTIIPRVAAEGGSCSSRANIPLRSSPDGDECVMAVWRATINPPACVRQPRPLPGSISSGQAYVASLRHSDSQGLSQLYHNMQTRKEEKGERRERGVGY